MVCDKEVVNLPVSNKGWVAFGCFGLGSALTLFCCCLDQFGVGLGILEVLDDVLGFGSRIFGGDFGCSFVHGFVCVLLLVQLGFLGNVWHNVLLQALDCSGVG